MQLMLSRVKFSQHPYEWMAFTMTVICFAINVTKPVHLDETNFFVVAYWQPDWPT